MRKLIMFILLAVAVASHQPSAAAVLTDNGNGTVTDSLTRLTWQQGEPGTMTWLNAIAYCEGLSLAGHADWRLPNVKELSSIMDDMKFNPAIDMKFFPGTAATYYWSSTSYTFNPSFAWSPGFNYGRIVHALKSDATVYVRCVRGEQLFAISGSGGIANAAVTLSGTAAAVTTSAASGAYSFSDLANGAYTVTPTLAGYSFTPAAQTVTLADRNITVPSFTASPVNQPPRVTLTTPGNNASYTALAAISLAATASDPDGNVSKVEFYRNGLLIGTDTTAPYGYTWSNVPAGTYVLTAVATDNSGAKTTSAAATVTVNSASRVNVALATNGATATASSTGSYLPSAAIDGDRKGINTAGAVWMWRDSTFAAWPDWLQVTFNGQKTISEIDIFTAQDNMASPQAPTATMTFTQNGITAFDVQYWTGTAWKTITSVTGNNLIWRKATFTPVATTRIRVVVSAALANSSRITEIEAY